MRTLAVLSLLALAPIVGSTVQTAEAGEMPDRGVILHLSHGKKAAHHVIHPLVRAKHMSAGGMGVLVYLDVDAAPLAFADAKPVSFHDHDSTALMKEILANGGRVVVCAECAKAHGKTETDLLEGATIAKPDDFFTVGEKTVTFDY